MTTDNALADTIAQFDAPSSDAKPVRGVPRWLVVGLVCLAVGGTGWLAWSAWNAATGGRQVVVLNRDPDGTVERVGTGWLIRSGRGRLTVTPKADGAAGQADWSQATCTFAFEPGDAAAPGQQQLLELVSNLLSRKEENAAFLGLSPEQVQGLEQIDAARREAVALSSSEQQRVRGLIAEHEKRAAAAEKSQSGAGDTTKALRPTRDQLCDIVESVARDKLAAARRVSAAQALAVPKALTEAQWVKYRGSVPTDKPSTRPARRGRPG